MAADLWINLPVKDVARASAFFTHVGFTPKPGPGTTEHSACFSIGDQQIILMLFAEHLFAGFTGHALSDTAAGTEVLFSLGASSRAQVEELAERARSGGGTVFAEPRESNGFMYGCGFCDPDGHRWNALYMDPAPVPAS